MKIYRMALSMRLLHFVAALVFMSFCSVYSVFAQTTAFSYQGTLNVGGVPANGSFDLQFKMFDSVSGGTQQGSTVTKNAVAVANGLFAVTLDFGASVFPGANRFLEISAQTAGGAGFTTLSPRSPVLSTPYSIQSVSANTAGTAAFATSAGSAQSISGPLTSSNPTAALAVTNNALGIANPDLNNLPPAGLKAESTATNDQTAGVIGISNSNYGAGVLGIAKGSAQPGNVGLQTVGVVGIAVSTTGPANGIRGETLSAVGWGVHGVADSTTGNANGVVGETYSPFGAAFFGRSFGTGDLIKLNNDAVGYPNPRFRVAWDGTVTSSGNFTAGGFVRSTLTISSGGTAALPNFSVALNGDVSTTGGIRAGNVPGSGAAFSVGQNGDVSVAGNISVAGNLSVSGSKNNIVKLDNGRSVLLYALESPDNWFEDFGTVKLNNGRAIVKIDKTFAQTTNVTIPYKVFLTPNGRCRGLYVTRKTADSFEVREIGGGRSNVEFDFRIVARRIGYENVRFAPAQLPPSTKK